MSSQLLDPNKEQTPHEVQVETLARIEVAVKNELFELAHAIEHRPINAVAWISRNLLELNIWSYYCALSAENAVRFYDDHRRDALDSLDLPDGFSRDPTSTLRQYRSELLEKATQQGDVGLDDAYQRVSTAAKSINFAETFKAANKLFSKFAHPTAIYIFGGADELEGLRDMLSRGIDYGNEALRVIQSFRETPTDARPTSPTAPQTAGSAPPPPSNSPANSHN